MSSPFSLSVIFRDDVEVLLETIDERQKTDILIGAYLAYAGGLHLTPPPIGILTYYGFASMNTPQNQKGANIKTSSSAAVTLSQVQKYLDEPVNTNMTPTFNMFHPECLLPDLSRNPDYKQPEANLDNPADNRIIVMRWILQEDGYEPWFGGLETDLKDGKWERGFPPTFMVHGDEDMTVPVSDSRKLLYVLGMFWLFRLFLFLRSANYMFRSNPSQTICGEGGGTLF